MTAILEACARVQVKGIICFDMGLTLREGDREYYYAALDRHFPGLKEKYIRTYGNAYEVPSPDSGKLMALFRSFCRDHGMMYKPDECFEYMGRLPEKFEQISFLDGKNPLKGEYLLPTIIDGLIHSGRARVKVIPCREKWCGVTYKEDAAGVKAELQSKKDKGFYPDKFWK